MSFDKYTETEPYESGFAQFYEDSILPHLHVLMEKRSKVHRETKRRNVLAGLGSFAIAGATGAFGFFFDNIPGVLWSVVGAAIAGAVSSMWIWAGRPAIEFRADAKRRIFADILAFFDCKHLIDKQDLYPIHSNLITAKIFEFYTKVEIDDAFIITRQGRQISFAEVTLKFEREKSADKVVFQGLFMCMEMREPLDNIAVHIHPKRKGLIANSGLDIKIDEMHGEYEVHGSIASVEKALTPEVRSAIEDLSKDVGWNNLGLSFNKLQVYIKIRQQGNLFESLTKHHTQPTVADVKKLVREVHEVLVLADRLIEVF